MLCLFALTGEGDPSGGCVDEAADEHSLGCALAGYILGHFIVQLIRPEHVAAVTIHTVSNKNNLDFSPQTFRCIF